MAAEVIYTCAHILIDAYDISAQMTDVTVNYGSESLDATTMGGTARKHKGGLKTSQISGAGYVNLGSSLSDAILFANVGTDDVLATVFLDGIPTASTVDGFAMGSVLVNYTHGGSVGTLLPFDISMDARDELVQPAVTDNALSTVWSTGTTNGSAVNVTHCSTAERLYAGFHVTALSTSIVGNGVSAVIQAASSSGFTTSNNRISFSAQTCKKGTFATPIASGSLSTDQPWFRSVVTVATGTSTGYTANGLIWLTVK